jgi:outer membrane protein assembly factor BamB
MNNCLSKTLSVVIVFVSFIFSHAIAAVDGDWSSWRGPHGNGIAEAGQTLPVEWSETKHVKWKASVPGRGHSTPIVVGDNIILTTAREEEGLQSVLCYSFTSGDLLWEKIILEGKLPGKIHKKNTHASPSVACDGERIYVVFFVAGDRLHLFSLDLKGNELWRKDVGRFYPERSFGYGTSPLLAGGNVVVTAESQGEGYIAAFDCDTGEEVWRTVRTAERSSHGTPVLANINGINQIVLNGADRVASYNPENGHELWSVAGGDPLIANTVLWKDGVVFASGGYPGIETWAIDVEKRSIIWSSPAKCYEQSMVLVDDHLYGIAEGGLVHCWDVADGNLRWRERLPKGPESSSPILAGGHIYHANEEGKIFVIKPNAAKLELIAENQLGDEIFATPVICRNRILVRTASYEGQARSETLYSIGF